jgi:hypothetical protein
MLINPIDISKKNDELDDTALTNKPLVTKEYYLSGCSAFDIHFYGNYANVLFNSANTIFDDEEHKLRVSNAVIFYKNIFRKSRFADITNIRNIFKELESDYNITDIIVEIEDDFEGGGPWFEYLFGIVFLFIIKQIAGGFLKKLGEALFDKIKHIRKKSPAINNERHLKVYIIMVVNNNIILLELIFVEMLFGEINDKILSEIASKAEMMISNDEDISKITFQCSKNGILTAHIGYNNCDPLSLID